MRPGLAPRFENLPTGTVVRNGPGATVAVIDVPFFNQGTIRLESAILRIDGDYTHPGGATLETVIRGSNPGTDFGQLQVAGTATLGGTLVATNAPGFTPAPGQTFTVLTCGVACTGTFATVVGGYPVQYNARDVTLAARWGRRPTSPPRA